MTISKTELMDRFTPADRMNKTEKQRLTEKLARDRRKFLKSGGQVRQIPEGITAATIQEWGREALSEPVDDHEFAAMLGTSREGLIGALIHGKLWGHELPEPIKKRGRRQWTLSAALNFRAKVLRDKAA